MYRDIQYIRMNCGLWKKFLIGAFSYVLTALNVIKLINIFHTEYGIISIHNLFSKRHKRIRFYED